MSKAAKLDDSPINLKGLRAQYRLSLLNLLDQYPGRKILILDPALAGPLGLMVEVSDLREHGVESWFELSAREVDSECPQVLFLLRPDPRLVGLVAKQILAAERKRADKTNAVIFIPRRAEHCVQLLRQHNVFSCLDVHSLPFFLFPLDNDVISMEERNTFSNFHVQGDPTTLFNFAGGLLQLQELCGGVIPHIRAIGPAAKYVADSLMRLRREQQAALAEGGRGGAQGGSRLRSDGGLLSPGCAVGGDSDPLSCMGVLSDDSVLSCAPDPHAPLVPPVKHILHTQAVRAKTRIRPQGAEVSSGTGVGASTPFGALKTNAGETVGPSPSESPPSAFDPSASAGAAVGEEAGVWAPQIEVAVLIDRRVDLVTPLVTPFTYEAMLDLVFGISNSYVEVSGDILPPPAQQQKEKAGESPAPPPRAKKTKVSLNSNDRLYDEIRDKHISVLGPLLHSRAAEIQQAYKKKDTLKSLPEINEFMKTFKQLQADHGSLSTHVNLASHINKHAKEEQVFRQLQLEDEIMGGSHTNGPSADLVQRVEEIADSGAPVTEFLRMACMLSLASNGLKAKQMDQLRNACIQTYGFHELVTLLNLDSLGLFRLNQGRSTWDNVKSAFDLLAEEGKTPEGDVSEVCSGYAPLSVRLVQKLHSSPRGWRAYADSLNLLLGPALEVQQQAPHSSAASSAPSAGTGAAAAGGGKAAERQRERARDRGAMKRLDKDGKPTPTVVLVCFLGGCTYAEVAALRRLNQLEGRVRRYVVATTEMINSRTLLESLRPKMPSGTSIPLGSNLAAPYSVPLRGKFEW